MKDIIKKLELVNKEISKRYAHNALERYNKGKIVHEKQMQFHKCQKRNRWVFGGNRSGKTECGAVETIWISRGVHPFRKNKKSTTGWVVSVSRQVQREVAQSKILHYLNPDWIVDIFMTEGRKTGYENGIIDYIVIKNVFGLESKIYFKSADQGREKFQGASLDFVWFDEEPPFDIYMECVMRVMDKQGDIFGTMTPLKGLTWVYNEIYLNEKNNPEVWSEHIEWNDNPFLNKEEIDLLTSSLSQSELESRRYGKFASYGGLVYPEFDENIHVIEPFNVPKEWQDNISIDPGLNNPLSAHWYAVDYDGNIYVIAEHYEAKKDIVYHSNRIKEISNQLGWHKAFNGMISAIIDSAATQRTLSAEKNVVELFYDNGILANPKINKDLFSGISRVKAYLKNGDGKAKLFIFKNCVNLIKEIKGYFWGKGDNPIKKDDHSLDELRYYICTRPENAINNKIKSEIQKDKEKLMKKRYYY